jgi:hypothetical protein
VSGKCRVRYDQVRTNDGSTRDRHEFVTIIQLPSPEAGVKSGTKQKRSPANFRVESQMTAGVDEKGKQL